MSVHDFHIDTPRLTISCFNPALDSHCDFILDLSNSPEVRAADGGVATPLLDREAVSKNIKENQPRMNTAGYGRYLVCLKASPNPSTGTNGFDTRPFSQQVEGLTKIGIVSMKRRKFKDSPLIPDIGFAFMRPFWGKGYATEASSALIKYFEENWGQTAFLGMCNADNENSKAMFRRLGFKDEGVRQMRGVAPGGNVIQAMVWSKGLTKLLGEYGI